MLAILPRSQCVNKRCIMVLCNTNLAPTMQIILLTSPLYERPSMIKVPAIRNLSLLEHMVLPPANTSLRTATVLGLKLGETRTRIWRKLGPQHRRRGYCCWPADFHYTDHIRCSQDLPMVWSQQKRGMICCWQRLSLLRASPDLITHTNCCICMYIIYIYIHICVYMCVCVCVHIHICINFKCFMLLVYVHICLWYL